MTKRRRKRTQPELPGRPPGPGGHVSYAVEGCGCLQCRYHRRPGSTSSVLRALGLERLLSGEERLTAIGGGAGMRDSTWDALTGTGHCSSPVREPPFGGDMRSDYEEEDKP